MTAPAPNLAVDKPLAAASSDAPGGRDSALDYTKGILVLFMVLYHWLNYFVAASAHFFNYLRFLTPSFIFITGFMISQIHFQKYGTGSLRLPGRLMVRGLKLLAVFVALNLIIGFAIPSSSIRQDFTDKPLADSLFSVFVSGNVRDKSVAFLILVPIAYLLIVSAPLILIGRKIKYSFHCACALSVVGIFLLSRNGLESSNLELLMIGMLGVVLGYARKEQVAAIIGHPYIVLGLYAVYLIVITIWNVTLPIQTVGAVLTTILIYAAGRSWYRPALVRGQAVLVGKYSLVGYIAQIAILQVLRRIHWFYLHGIGALLLSLFLGFALTVLVVYLLDWSKARSKIVDQLYRWVFA